jgi:hypothetical protein
VPANNTMKLTSFDFEATIGAIKPPSLCPIRPILFFLISFLVFKYAIALSTSVAKSAEVAVLKSPVDCPTPLSSYRKTAISFLVK